MKLRSLALAAIAACSVSLAQAQIGVGLNAGVLVSGQDIENNDNEIDTETVTGFTVGVPIEIALSNVFSVQPEINFQQRGVTAESITEVAGLKNGYEYTTTSNVLEIPILAKLGYTTESFTVAAVVGPSIAYTLSAEQEFDTYLADVKTSTTNDVDFDKDGAPKRTDINGIIGLQGGIPAGPGKVILDARYRVGFTNLNDGDNSNNNDFETKSKGYSATVGYMITLGDY